MTEQPRSDGSADPAGAVASDRLEVDLADTRPTGGHAVAAAEPTLSDQEAAALAATARHSRATATWTAYESDVALFTAWCADRDPPVQPLPASALTVAVYLQHLADAGYAKATIQRRRWAISAAHQLAGHTDQHNPCRSPQVQTTWEGIARTLRDQKPRKAKALRIEPLRQLSRSLGDDLTALRDRAIIVIGYAAALRRSTLSLVDVDHVTLDDGGLLLHIPYSKTDQEGTGRTLGLPYGSRPGTCPVRCWQAWLAASAITAGAAFRDTRWGRVGPRRLSDRAIADMLARRASAAGLHGAYTGHSMRAGMATDGYANGVPELAIMRHGGWTSSRVMRGYIEEGHTWSDNAAAQLGL